MSMMKNSPWMKMGTAGMDATPAMQAPAQPPMQPQVQAPMPSQQMARFNAMSSGIMRQKQPMMQQPSQADAMAKLMQNRQPQGAAMGVLPKAFRGL